MRNWSGDLEECASACKRDSLRQIGKWILQIAQIRLPGDRRRFRKSPVVLFQFAHSTLALAAAHDHSSARAFLQEIHPTGLTAVVFAVPDSPFGDTGMGHGNIAGRPAHLSASPCE